MKKFMYLLMALMLLCGLSMNAQTYGKPYRPQYTQRQHFSGYSQAPTVIMRSTSTLSGSGSTLPQAAITGTYTADQMNAATRGPRRVGEGGGFADQDDYEDDKDDPNPDLPGDNVPIGDALLPLMLCALAYLIFRARKRAKGERANG